MINFSTTTRLRLQLFIGISHGWSRQQEDSNKPVISERPCDFQNPWVTCLQTFCTHLYQCQSCGHIRLWVPCGLTWLHIYFWSNKLQGSQKLLRHPYMNRRGPTWPCTHGLYKLLHTTRVRVGLAKTITPHPPYMWCFRCINLGSSYAKFVRCQDCQDKGKFWCGTFRPDIWHTHENQVHSRVPHGPHMHTHGYMRAQQPYRHVRCLTHNQGISQGFDSGDQPSNLTYNWI